LAVRPGVRLAARDADVLPGRPAVPVRPDHAVRPGRAGAAAARQHLRPRDDRAGLGARVSLRHRPPRPGSHADGRLTWPRATGRGGCFGQVPGPGPGTCPKPTMLAGVGRRRIPLWERALGGWGRVRGPGPGALLP